MSKEMCPDCNVPLMSTPIYKNWSMKKIIGINLFCPTMDCLFEKDISVSQFQVE